MTSVNSSTLTPITAQSSSLIVQPSPTPVPYVAPIASTVKSAIITSTLEIISSSQSPGLLREGAGIALNAVYIAMFILLGLCILFCIISSTCWCCMKYKQDKRFNNFMNTPPAQSESRHERDDEP